MTRLIMLLCALLITTPSYALQSHPAPKKQASTPAPDAPKGYPNDVKQAFVASCIGVNKQMADPCKCITLTFERMVPYKEFIELTKMEDPTNDPRFTKVVGACLKAQQQQ